MRGSGGELGLSFTGIVGNNTLTSVKLTQPTRKGYLVMHWITQIGDARRAWANHAPYETAKKMKCFRKVKMRSRTADTTQIIDHIRLFCSRSAHFAFLGEESVSCSTYIGPPSCVIASTGLTATNTCIAMSESKPAVLEVTNIFPKQTGDIHIDEANEIASQFAKVLEVFAKNVRFNLRVDCGTDSLDAQAMFRDKRILRFFERILVANPRSSHPSDLEKIDRFICVLSRYYRGEFCLERLSSLLIQDYKWAEDNARRCAERVDIGLDVLRVNRKF